MEQSQLNVRVARKVVEAVDICTFELIDPSGHALPAFSAGSHIDVRIRDGLVRQYSLANDSRETGRYLIGVLRDPNSRGGSQAMHDQVAEGDLIAISTPKNHFPLSHDAKRSILLAGGIGITPILCMAERLANIGADFVLHYCARSRERTAFFDRIKGSHYADHVHFHFDDGPDSQKFDGKSVIVRPDAGEHLYVCGPKGFMDYVLGLARNADWHEAQLHYEFFSAGVIQSEQDAAFQVRLASSNKVIEVPRDQSVVKALAHAGVEIATSCEQGVCGTCLTRVLEGIPDHKDFYLTPDEQAQNDQFLPCCSRSKTPILVLDL